MHQDVHRLGGVIQGSFPGGRPMIRPAAPAPGAMQPVLQRAGASPAGAVQLDPRQLFAGNDPGRPLPSDLRREMETLHRADFSAVRIHEGHQATALGALAFTWGSHVFFAPGQFQPAELRGRRLLAHELTHVVQQRAGRVRNPFGTGLAVVQDPRFEAEAERMALRVPPQPALQAKPAAPVTPAVQGATAVQMVRHGVKPIGPPPAMTGKSGGYWYYKKGGTTFATDRTHHWYWKPGSQSWIRTKTSKAPTYNRFRAGNLGRGGFRAASFKGRLGSGASYGSIKMRGVRIKGAVAVAIGPALVKKRKYVAAMQAATETELPNQGTGSATTYASYWPAAPVIAGGYNWCHLVGHGGGGSDDPANLAAASTHNNSEQLAIERIVYQYKKSGVGLVVNATLHGTSEHLARWLTYIVTVNGDEVYRRRMDAWRKDKPTFFELTAIEIAVTNAITDALE
jgi:hypothetical protein